MSGRMLRTMTVTVLGVWMMLGSARPASAQISANTPATTASPAVDNPLGIPDLTQMAPPATDGKGVSASLRILVLMTVLTLAPSILIMMTSFTRIMIVLALLRQAIGTQQLPPGQVLTGLALIMTMLVMAPTWREMKADAVDPYLDGKLGQSESLERGAKPLRAFMFRQIEAAGNEEHVYVFSEYVNGPLPDGAQLDRDKVGMAELVSAFVLSELKTSFVMGFKIYLPFLVIDMVIASILISMGMMMLPPVLISLPFKLMLFVLADGWGLVVGSLLHSFA
ncbi:MAG: flagellar type III secretion system pore protein FliP [Planctomycetota bacterium]